MHPSFRESLEQEDPQDQMVHPWVKILNKYTDIAINIDNISVVFVLFVLFILEQITFHNFLMFYPKGQSGPQGPPGDVGDPGHMVEQILIYFHHIFCINCQINMWIHTLLFCVLLYAPCTDCRAACYCVWYLHKDSVFQGPAGQRGPEGPPGKPGEDVSQPWVVCPSKTSQA